jgi:hypothetical protein
MAESSTGWRKSPTNNIKADVFYEVFQQGVPASRREMRKAEK